MSSARPDWELDLLRKEMLHYYGTIDLLRKKFPIGNSDYTRVPTSWDDFQETYDYKSVIHEIRKHTSLGGICFILNEINENLAKQDKMICSHLHVASVFLKANEDIYIKQRKTEEIYIYNMETDLYEPCGNSQLKSNIISFMTEYTKVFENKKFINKDAFDDDEFDPKEYSKDVSKYKMYCSHDGTVNGIINIFKSIITFTDTQFDNEKSTYDILAFKNGNLNLTTGEFKRRTRFDYQTKCLSFDYDILYDQNAYDEIDDFFRKIQPDEIQRKFTVEFLRYCLQGGNPEAKMKMNIGYSACNGKSTELELHETVFDIYTYKLNRDTFNKGCNKLHKYLAKCISHPIRLAYVNELDEKKLDHQLLKDIIDCKSLELEKLYSTMTEESNLQAKFMTTSNNDPSFSADKGLMRRVAFQHYNSQFVKEELVNEDDHKYLIDKYYINKFDRDEYKLAYTHYLLNANKNLTVPKENEELVSTMICENDEIYSILTEHFEITNSRDDKVSFADVQSLFPDLKVQQLNRELKRFDINYDKNLQINGRRKVYLGLKLLPNENEDDPE